MLTSQVDLSVIIVNWNTRQLLLQTVASVYANLPEGYTLEIIVVDNGSSDGSPEALRQTYPAVRLIANQDNRGFSAANNQGLRVATGRYSLLLNSDTIVLPDSLKQVLDFMEAHPRVGLCGIQILNPDGSFQGSYAPYLNLWIEFLILSGLGRKLIHPDYPSARPEASQKSQPVQTIQGAFMFARSEALTEIGGLDECFFMYGEENDLSLRLYRAGWTVYYLAEAKILHLGGQSTRKRFTRMAWQLQKSKYLLFKKHYGPLPALSFKLLVSLAALAKLSVTRIKYRTTSTRKNWFSWSDFYQFLRT